MTPEDKAIELYEKYDSLFIAPYKKHKDTKQCALIAVDYIITSNPHSNPFNTNVYSTMSYWQEVKTEIEKL